MAEKLRGILEELKEINYIAGVEQWKQLRKEKLKSFDGIEIVDYAIAEIKSLFKNKLPKKITAKEVKSKFCPYSDKIKCCTMQDYSRNECLTEIEKIVEEL